MRLREAPRTRRSMWVLLLAVAYAAVGTPVSAVDIKIATVAPDGSRWMQGHGCAERPEVPVEGDMDGMVACGMGHVPELGQRFLELYAPAVDPCPPCGMAHVPRTSQGFLEHYTAEDE